MCATINDNQRMQEKCDEYGEKLISFYSLDTEDANAEKEDKDLLFAVIEEVSSEYIALAVKAVKFLARCILEDLDEPYFLKLFSNTDKVDNYMIYYI